MVVTTTIYVNTTVIMTITATTTVIMTMATTKTMIVTMNATTTMIRNTTTNMATIFEQLQQAILLLAQNRDL